MPRCVPRPEDRCRVNPFFNVLVRRCPVRLARLCVRASVVPCIRRGRRLPDHVHWELARACRERRVPAADLAVHRAGRVNGMSHAV